ncbi:cAMP-binding transcriptional regulator [Ameyamaea chiangmaiensis NBRC 103196]|uniref:Helix-turn-helix domain-containing protein n=1 Tax=Ameyamaea chiangmaiensis TaxID=442969 RepID=A0A850PEQ0_9PROT|nr:helix-turn-helix domain-containing protein [Ameyamaea chiangmaiensis]MBS4075871.1 helix-turn-helix domain-containing protein [Ameyamaea chiangmaiensis]NVN40940.1 helix-turn-helix domain-containing protein [Ameyamaea chiangmaiensis]GBQ64045.1 cAMP-binding transcriptional regulator [Ameyamaea chiangmaiensis NBRC 103196]
MSDAATHGSLTGLRSCVRPGNRAGGVSQCSRCGARKASVCNAIGDPDLDRLAASVVHMTVPPGCSFIEDGAEATDFFNITSGTAKLFKLLPDGRRQITGFATAGHFLGLAVGDHYAFGAEAIDTVHLCRFSRPRMTRLMDDFPRLERRLLEEASNELVVAQNQMLLLGRKTARERVATFLLERLRNAEEDDVLVLPMTRTDIADYLGLTIETVSRTLSALRKEGLIADAGSHNLRLLDADRLADIAEGDRD